MPRERVKVTKVRTLGGERSPTRPAAKKQAVTAARAKDVLRAEFDRVLAMKEKLAAESAVGGKEKGRASGRGDEKLRALVASLEGMSRFALQLGLLTPADSRAMFADAMKRGLYEGWQR